jgi:hypothetical protein
MIGLWEGLNLKICVKEIGGKLSYTGGADGKLGI